MSSISARSFPGDNGQTTRWSTDQETHSASSEIQKISFKELGGDVLEVVTMPDGRNGVVIARICDNLEITVWRQIEKLKANPLSGANMMLVPNASGSPQKTWVLPCNRVAWWLSTINAKKVKASLSPKLLQYQKNAADALDAWANGKTREEVTAVDVPARAPMVQSQNPPATHNEILLQAVQSLVNEERARKQLESHVWHIESKVEDGLTEMNGRVRSLEIENEDMRLERESAEHQLSQLPEPDELGPHHDIPDLINKCVKALAWTTVNFPECHRVMCDVANNALGGARLQNRKGKNGKPQSWIRSTRDLSIKDQKIVYTATRYKVRQDQRNKRKNSF